MSGHVRVLIRLTDLIVIVNPRTGREISEYVSPPDPEYDDARAALEHAQSLDDDACVYCKDGDMGLHHMRRPEEALGRILIDLLDAGLHVELGMMPEDDAKDDAEDAS